MAGPSTSFDDVLERHVGSFGRGQLKILLIASLSHIAMAAVLMLMVFTAQDPIAAGVWECLPAGDTARSHNPLGAAEVDLLPTTAATCAAIHASITGSSASASTAATSVESTAVTAGHYSSGDGTASGSNNNNNKSDLALPAPPPALPPLATPAQQRAAFCALPANATRWTSAATSMLSYYDLTCGREWLVNLLNSVYFVGLAAGGTGFGALSDRFGRRASMYGCAALGAVATLGEALAPTFWLHALSRVIGAAALQGMGIADVVLVTEMVGPDHRGRVGILTQSFFIAGECLLSLLAALVPDWRTLTLLCGALLAAFLATAPLVPESPRWLAAAGRRRQAAGVLARIARMNHRRRGQEEGEGEVPLEPLLLSALEEAEGKGGKGAGGDAKAEGQGEAAGKEVRGGAVKGPGAADKGKGKGTERDVIQSWSRVGAAPGSGAEGEEEEEEGEGRVGTWDVGAVVVVSGKQGAGATGCATGCGRGSDSDSGSGNVTAAGWPSGGTAAPKASEGGEGDGGCNAAQQQQQQLQQPPPSLREAVRHPLVRRYAGIVSLAMCTLVLSYYGVGFALSYIPGSLYVSFFLISVAEAPSSVVVGLLIDRLGRCALVLGGMAVSGLACVACGLAEGAPAAQVVLAMLGKFGCSGAWSVLVVYCAEVFPTSVRSLLSGAIFQGARVGGVVAPFVFLLGDATGVQQLPFWLMGAVTLGAASLCVFLPETRGSAQPESLAQLEVNSGRTVAAALRAMRRRGRGRGGLHDGPGGGCGGYSSTAAEKVDAEDEEGHPRGGSGVGDDEAWRGNASAVLLEVAGGVGGQERQELEVVAVGGVEVEAEAGAGDDWAPLLGGGVWRLGDSGVTGAGLRRRSEVGACVNY
ncbi:hypothetical protein PLESTB_000005500 [Pleodorina starrii]|uniref:Major facilitator superfamily (MFS) profile domain-containing protein n=1 Tax=Pleodorina starrii TaxID=330485 RepID=A0A9W6B7V8_9CHLO|nr:hypothetical protein PLESTB_000005500 [Pleodorina starrii]